VNKITIEPARNGTPSSFSGSIRIHSAYNPGKEAKNFLAAHLDDIRDKTTIVIIGAGLGYIDQELRNQRPESNIIALHLSNTLYNSRIQDNNYTNSVKRWYPGSEESVELFLYNNLLETAIGGLRILKWPAAIKVFPGIAEESITALSAVIRRHSGNISTTAAFGRLWINNSLRNYLNLNQVIIQQKIIGPVVLTASGPSLEKTLNYLIKYRDRFHLWALPSSLPALKNAGLIPQLIISTDPGYWARLHTRFFPEEVPVAMPLSSAPIPVPSLKTLLISQNTPGEAFLLKNDKWPRYELPTMGTVAASAIELWKQISSGPMVITGLDLCWFDLRSHARPHSFDSWLTIQSSRKNPMNHILWERAENMAPTRSGAFRSGPAMRTYTDWFRGNIPVGRIFRLTPGKTEVSVVPIPGIPDTGPDIFRDFSKQLTRTTLSAIAPPVDSQQRLENIRNLISQWKIKLSSRNPAFHHDAEELLYTLDPGGVLELEQSSQVEYPEIMSRHRKRVKKVIHNLELRYGR